ncbi:hypothetical protein ES703_21914 [subsurface metagenome]
MLEVRYDNETKVVTAWCGDENQFGNLAREGHTVVYLDIPIPSRSPCISYLYDEVEETLIDNPGYVEPPPPRDLAAEVDDLEARVAALEGI